ncbi:hypothetical protein ACFQL7_09155 [Halocatena marina]|uniref:Glucose-methanol-choline oxidoreductase N-terminal domain-containing protein n=1 Tax=Halocatena marina TaxID=2934937 RepID=A0ABD5YU25_9EURY
MMTDPDVVIIGAGADGPACASRLARKHGLDVLILEAGPWHGNKEWPNPHVEVGGSESSDPDDLDGKLLDEQYSAREADANDPTAGYLRVGPADHSRAPWFRDLHQNAFLWQISAVGGTSIHYFANHPRAYPYAVDEQPHWPIDYEDLVPYYKLNEQVTHVQQAPATAKEQLFFEGQSALATICSIISTSPRRAIDPSPTPLRVHQSISMLTTTDRSATTTDSEETHSSVITSKEVQHRRTLRSARRHANRAT